MLTRVSFVACILLCCTPAVGASFSEKFDGEPTYIMQANSSSAQMKNQALAVTFSKADWPNVTFKPKSGLWDWSDQAGIELRVYNPSSEELGVSVRVDNEGANGERNCNTASVKARPGDWTTLRLEFNTAAQSDIWGMRGVPSAAGRQGPTIDPRRITAFQVFLSKPTTEHSLILDDIRTFGTGGKPGEPIPMPFIDRFGQYKPANWPGKLTSESELKDRKKAEDAALRTASSPSGRDSYGGWTDGPKLKATGWFRTEKADGKWWLVDPDGHLFFSLGVDCVRLGDSTFTEGRGKWFEWLPDESSEFAPALGYTQNALKMAERIGGKGKNISFYRVNLIRKYGTTWQDDAAKTAFARLKAWGFNTIGSWSDAGFIEKSPVPFVGTLSSSGKARRIAGDNGYWGKMVDVFDPDFPRLVDESLAKPAEKYAKNPMLLGYFVDNELSWNGLDASALASPSDQPCRVEFIRRLKEKYPSIEALNKAWEINARDWGSLRAPGKRNKAASEDMDAFVYAFARKYFDTVKSALKKHDPNHLYLGCRFAWSNAIVVRACADVADVVSFNRYNRGINSADWTGKKDLGKPVIIGEFHFGALDRGMFSGGLVPVANQKERGEAFKKYVRSVLDCPAFVGCHWFEYTDEPNTGRVLDGENYNIGFVDVTDTPYPEMVEASKEIGAEMYTRRAKK